MLIVIPRSCSSGAQSISASERARGAGSAPKAKNPAGVSGGLRALASRVCALGAPHPPGGFRSNDAGEDGRTKNTERYQTHDVAPSDRNQEWCWLLSAP